LCSLFMSFFVFSAGTISLRQARRSVKKKGRRASLSLFLSENTLPAVLNACWRWPQAWVTARFVACSRLEDIDPELPYYTHGWPHSPALSSGDGREAASKAAKPTPTLRCIAPQLPEQTSRPQSARRTTLEKTNTC